MNVEGPKTLSRGDGKNKALRIRSLKNLERGVEHLTIYHRRGQNPGKALGKNPWKCRQKIAN